ncbi:hypothetical protein HOH87_05435, partial [bacterium]|nr:hypothetical protein [bacterium]
KGKSITNDDGTLEGDEVDLEADEDIVNREGTIKANTSLAMTAGGDVRNESVVRRRGNNTNSEDYVSRSSITSGGTMSLKAGSDIVNQGSDISSDGMMSLDAGRDIVVHADQLNSKRDTGSVQTQSTTHSRATISSGGNLISKSGRDTVIVGGDINVDGSAAIETGGDLKLIAVKDTKVTKSSKYSKSGGWFGRTQIDKKTQIDTKVNGSSLNIGGDAVVDAKGDIQLHSSQVNIDGNANVHADGDILLTSDRGGRVTHETRTKKGFMHSSGRTKDSIDLKSVGSGITSKGSMVVDAGGSMLLHGSDVKADGNLAMTAEKGIGILESENIKDSKTSSYEENGFWQSKRSESQDSYLTHTGSTVDSGGNLDLKSNEDIVIRGSIINTKGNANIDAAKGLTIESVVDQEFHSKFDEETNFAGIDLSVDLSRLGASASMSQTGDRKSSETTSLTQQGSQLNIGGNLVTKSGGDTNVIGSTVIANGDVDMDAGGNLNILSAEETQTMIEKDASVRNTITASVGNAWADTVHDVIDNVNNLQESEPGDGKASKVNQAAKQYKAVRSAVKAAGTVKNIARSASTAGTMGFYASVKQESQVKETERKNDNTNNKASAIVSRGGNLSLKADKDLTIRGSAVAAAGDIALDGDQVTIEAAENTLSNRESSHDYTQSQELFNTSGVLDGPTIGKADGSKKGQGSTWSNSRVNAGGTLTIKSRKDTIVSGAHVEADVVDLDGVGGTLKISSKQDTYTRDDESVGYSLGNSNSYNKAVDKADKAWVSDQTMIIGRKEVKGSLDTIENTGAVIANAEITRDENGRITGMKDKGNMNLTAETIVVNDLEDRDYQYSEGIGIGISGTNGLANTGKDFGSGSTNLKFSNSGHDKAQTTRGTFGKGSVTAKTVVKDGKVASTSDLNRDVSKRQTITKDKTLGGFDLDVTVDNRALTDTGGYVSDSVEDLAGLPGNAVQAGGRVVRASGDLADAVGKDLTGHEGVRDNGGFLGDYGNKTKLREASLRFGEQNKHAANVLKNPDAHTPQERNAALQTFNEYASREFGVKGSSSTSGYNGTELAKNPERDSAMADGKPILKSTKAGLYDKDNKSIHINDKYQDGSTKQLATVNGHELKHMLDSRQKKGTTESGANRFGDQSHNALSDEIGGGSSGDYASHQKWTTTHTKDGGFDRGNSLAGDATDVDAMAPAVAYGLVVGAGAITNLAVDYYSEYKKSKKDSIEDYWVSGEYPEFRGTVQLAVGGIGAAAGGGIGSLGIGMVSKVGLGMAVGGTATALTNQLLEENDSVVVGGLSGGTGIVLGNVLNIGTSKALSSLNQSLSITKTLGKTLRYGMEITRKEPSLPYALGTVVSNAGTDIGTSVLKTELENNSEGKNEK